MSEKGLYVAYALRSTQRLAGAILDLFPTEPLPADHPLWGFGNVVVTPQVAGPSTAEEIAPVFNDNWRAGCAAARCSTSSIARAATS